MKGYVSDQALAAYEQLVAESQGVDFAEGDTYDFGRCMRPDGSHYGTRGKCKKGTEVGAKEEKTSGAKPTRATSPKIRDLQDRIAKGDKAAMDEMRKLRAEGKVGKESAKTWGAGAKQRADEDIEGLRELMRDSPAAKRKLKEEAASRRPRAAIDSDAKQVVQQMKGAKGLELMKLRQKLQDLKAQARSPRPDVAAKRKANPVELKATLKSAQGAVKTAAAEVKRVARETKGDKSREALNRRLAAGQALDKAERAAFKASEKFFAAAKRESRAAMTPEQRKLEREADKLTKGG